MDKPGTIRDKTGKSRDKTGTSWTNQGQFMLVPVLSMIATVLSIPVPGLSLLVHLLSLISCFCPCLSLFWQCSHDPNHSSLGADWCYLFSRHPLVYLILVGFLNGEKLAEPVWLYVFKIAFQLSFLKGYIQVCILHQGKTSSLVGS